MCFQTITFTRQDYHRGPKLWKLYTMSLNPPPPPPLVAPECEKLHKQERLFILGQNWILFMELFALWSYLRGGGGGYLWLIGDNFHNLHTGKWFRVGYEFTDPGYEFIALRLLRKMAEHGSTFQVSRMFSSDNVIFKKKNWVTSRNLQNIMLTDRDQGVVE